VRIEGAVFRNGDRRIGEIILRAPEARYPFVLSLPQSDTERLILGRLEKLGVPVQWETRVVDLVVDADHVAATLELANGERRRVESAWLVGCDGAHSDVRTRLGVPFRGEREPEWFTLADVQTDWELSRDRAHIFFHRDGPLAIFPLPSANTIRIIAPLLKESSDGAPQPCLESFERLVRQRSGQSVRLHHAIWLSNFRISRRIVDRYRAGRILLAGDAAHVHSPVGGQGMNTGLHDAFNLAWKLALVERCQAEATLLDSYHHERYPIGLRTLRCTRLATKVITLRSRFAQGLRDFVVARVSRCVGHRMFRAISMLDIDYRQSSLVEDQGEAGAGIKSKGLRAGDRAPDFPVHSSSAGFDRFHEALRSTKHVLAWFDDGQTGPSTEAEVDLAGALDELARNYAEILECYRICHGGIAEGGTCWVGLLAAEPSATDFGTRMLYLIRPDGYIAWRGPAGRLSRLETYLERWFSAARLGSLVAL
jgi:2-polyprenyl-6-methoxyphenol hydroxylase-like FAD-dependent oxidoreductase